ncbi:MAG: acetylornithine deacetylase, partial [Flammeovirgaceae bacterium]|nr:acetylornithine deacetylase [Flammeovirgaceae bacterium]MDW8288175.1 acetylornithine deacetylase [Flammeovirgaceae bacterium]
MNINCSEFVELLKDLIRIPSFSGEEDQTATLLMDFLTKKSVCCYRKHNNVWAYHAWYDPQKPTILLNSHHDTVKPALGYTR